MNDTTKIRIIKCICWMGAVADAFWTLAFLWPELFSTLTGRSFTNGDLSMRLIAGAAASLLAGWTILLIWTARKPIERRAVLAFTALPVVAGLFCLTLVGFIVEESTTSWILLKTAGLFAAMLWAFFTANTLARENIDEIHNNDNGSRISH